MAPDEDRHSALKNRLCAAVLVAVGLAITVEALGFRLGSVARMGPGMFPAILGVLLALCGAAMWFVRDGAPAVPVRATLRPVLHVLGAMLAFALSVEPLGLLPATAALVAIAGLADPEHTWRSLTGLFVVATAAVLVVFVQLIGIPLRLPVCPF